MPPKKTKNSKKKGASRTNKTNDESKNKFSWEDDYRSTINKNYIGNKCQRTEVYQRQKTVAKKKKREMRKIRQKEAALLGTEEQERRKKQQKTQDNQRIADETIVEPEDEEVKGEEAIDEFARYFSGDRVPKVVITTSYHAKYGKRTTKDVDDFILDLLFVIPDSVYYKRHHFPMKTIVKQCITHNITDVIIINQDKKKLNALTLIHLPNGPTAYFKLSSIKLHKDIDGSAKSTDHRPEVILNNFTTRLGHRVGRMLAALFHQQPEFQGRRVCTWHNQRDFIFFRQHRYIFDDRKKARLQEIGPKFTLKLKWLQAGTFDTKCGEYEWKYNGRQVKSRRQFFL